MSTSHTLNVTSNCGPSGSGDKTRRRPWTHAARLQWVIHQRVNYCPRKSESWDKRSSVRPLAQTSCSCVCKLSPLTRIYRTPATTKKRRGLGIQAHCKQLGQLYFGWLSFNWDNFTQKRMQIYQSRRLAQSHASTFFKLQFESKLYRWSQLYLTVFKTTISILSNRGKG